MNDNVAQAVLDNTTLKYNLMGNVENIIKAQGAKVLSIKLDKEVPVFIIDSPLEKFDEELEGWRAQVYNTHKIIWRV